MEINDNEVLGSGRNIRATDLEETGPVVLTVTGAKWAEFTDQKTGKNERKQVLQFDDGREITLNATRSEQLGEIFGKPLKLGAVRGQQVKLFTIKVKGMTGGKVASVQFGKPDGAAANPF